ncbi:MAG: ferritin [Clostridium perfringens]|nr:ferritin [Clostridium perfringens]
MLSENLLQRLNEQVNFEFYSSYTYLAMAAYAESVDLSGFANFFKVQAQEELFHAMKFYDYIFQKNGVVELEQIDKPKFNFKIYGLADVAFEEKEHATMSLLKWFIDEQVEEENNFHSLLKKVRRSEGNPAALYMMDDELAARVFTPPTTTK